MRLRILHPGLLWIGLMLAAPAAAHDLHYQVTEAESIVVRLYYPDGTAFAYEAYEIYPQGEAVPFQVGRTDAQGRIAFVAPRAGRYRLRATSEDGHGVTFELEAGACGRLTAAQRPLYERYQRLFVGLGILLGVFGLINLFYRRKKS